MKILIKISFALLMFALMFLYANEFFNVPTYAETKDQAISRVMLELKTKHPDVWNGCDTACVQGTLRENGWWIVPLASKIQRPVTDTVKYAVTRAFDWGVNYELVKAANTDCKAKSTPTLNRCAPTLDDWVYAYPSIIEQTRADFDVSPTVFAVDQWVEKRYFRVNRTYGGPY